MTSKFVKLSSVLAGAATVAVSLLTPVAAQASQDTKNDWRNLGIGSAIIAGIGLINHNSTLTAIGAAGAVYSGTRYEQDRSNQAQQNDRWGWNRNDNRNDHRWYDRNSSDYRNGGDNRDNHDYGRPGDNSGYRVQEDR
jgi:hypothetical protein